jgi:hypothetical protein
MISGESAAVLTGKPISTKKNEQVEHSLKSYKLFY